MARKDSAALSGPDAKHLLKKMREVYREANSYADNSSTVFYGVERSTGSEQITPYTNAALAFERPNRLSLKYQESTDGPQAQDEYKVVSNGMLVRSAAKELPDQIHEAIAPRNFTADNFIPEPELRGTILKNTLQNTMPQLSLLLNHNAEQPVFEGEDKPRRLSDGELDGVAYYRLELFAASGKRVFWIDQNQFTLRRMEVPIDNQKKLIDAQSRYSKIAVWLDFENVSLNAEIEEQTFELAVPEEARRVRRFIPPPRKAPADFLGQPTGQFSFTSLEGEAVTPDTLAGKVVILDFWFTQCAPCQAQTPTLNKVYQHFAEVEDVTFLAVSTDSRVLPNEVIVKTLTNWGGEIPIVRDLQKTGYSELNIRQTPSLLILDREGRLQLFHVGVNQNHEQLIEVIQRVVDGENLADTIRQKHAESLKKYEIALETAEIKDTILEVEITRPNVPRRRMPENLRLTQLWQTTSEKLQQPGDLLALAGENQDSNQLMVLDESKAIVEFDWQGENAKRHELPSAQEPAGGFIRSWENTEGKRWYLVSGVGWQQVHVFDDEWKRVLSFPDEQHSGIGDVLLGDLSGSGEPMMYIGYWGGLGVQGGTLDGRRLWANRQLDHVLQIGLGPVQSDGSRTTWSTSTRGTLMHLAANGRSLRELYVQGHSLMYFNSQPDGKHYCGLAIGKAGQYRAVGFNDSISVSWEYPLPPGEYLEQVPRVLSMQLPSGDASWLIVAADGSLHWLNLQGELIDRFEYGDILTGVTTAQQDDGTTLLFVSTAENVTAWQIKGASADAESKPEAP